MISDELEAPRVCVGASEPIDAVYTWVNGSDPDFLLGLEKYCPEFHNKEYEG